MHSGTGITRIQITWQPQINRETPTVYLDWLRFGSSSLRGFEDSDTGLVWGSDFGTEIGGKSNGLKRFAAKQNLEI